MVYLMCVIINNGTNDHNNVKEMVSFMSCFGYSTFIHDMHSFLHKDMGSHTNWIYARQSLISNFLIYKLLALPVSVCANF